MAEIRIHIPDDVIANLQMKLGTATKPTDIARDALTMYNWAINESANGKVVLAANTEATEFTKLAMPGLQSSFKE